MKCKICENDVKTIITDLNYQYNEDIFKVTNIPANYCKKCREIIIPSYVEKQLLNYIPKAKDNVVNYKQCENDEISVNIAFWN